MTVYDLTNLNTAPIKTVAAPIAEADTLFDFIDTLGTAAQARRYVAWSLGNTLNNHIIAQLQAHIRAEERNVPMPSDMDQATIDKFNEQLAALDEMLAFEHNREEQGFDAPVKAIDIAEKLVNIRMFIADTMDTWATGPRDRAQPIGESLAYRLRQTPIATDRELQAVLAIDPTIPVDALRRIIVQTKVNDRDRLLAQAPHIIEMSKQLAWRRGSVSEADAEGLFDELPAPTRYRLLGSVVRSLVSAMDAEVKALIRFGRTDAVANRLMINDTLERYKLAFTKFGADHADELIDYESRGSRLPTLDELLASKG